MLNAYINYRCKLCYNSQRCLKVTAESMNVCLQVKYSTAMILAYYLQLYLNRLFV